MLDAIIRPYITPSLDKIAQRAAAYNIPVNLLTLAGFGIGIIGCFFVAIQSYLFGLLFIIGSRVLAGVDGALARRTVSSNFGAYLERVCDYIFYAAFVFFFILAAHAYYLAGAFLIFSYIGMNASHLAQAGIAAGHDKAGEPAGLVGHSEIILFMTLACLFPLYFPALAFLFGLLCWTSTAMRMMQAWRSLSAMERNYDEAENIS